MNDTIEYAASLEAVLEMLTDEEFQSLKCVETKAVRYDVDITRSKDTTAIATRRAVPTERFPDFARRIVGRSITIVQKDVWQNQAPGGRLSGTIHVTVEGVPIWLKGTLGLTPMPWGTHEDIRGDLHASIPLIGNRLERAALPALQAAVNAERRVGQQWLQERAS